MTGKERLLRLFNGKDLDRVPIWLLFPYFSSKAYANIFEAESYKSIIGKIYKHTEIIDRRSFDTGFCFNTHPDIKSETRNYRENGDIVSEHVISCKGIELKSTVRRTGENTAVESFVKDINDLDRILSLPYLPPKPDTAKFMLECAELGERGLMGVDLADPLSILHSICSETDFCIFTITDTGKVCEFLDVMFERVYDTYKYLLEQGVGPVFWISGAEFAVPPMVSPAYFGQLVVKYTKKLCDLIRDCGMWSMIHCHGKIGKVLNDLKEIGFDSLHPIEAPPMGDCTLTTARNCLGKDVILAGNIQYGDLWEKSEEEIEELVKCAIDEGKTGRFMLAATGGPSALEISENVSRNYSKVIDAALKYGKL